MLVECEPLDPLDLWIQRPPASKRLDLSDVAMCHDLATRPSHLRFKLRPTRFAPFSSTSSVFLCDLLQSSPVVSIVAYPPKWGLGSQVIGPLRSSPVVIRAGNSFANRQEWSKLCEKRIGYADDCASGEERRDLFTCDKKLMMTGEERLEQI